MDWINVVTSERILKRHDRQPVTAGRRSRRSAVSGRIVQAVISVAAFVGIWELIVHLTSYPAFILPSPVQVLRRAADLVADGTLWHHTWVTLGEVLLGVAL